MIFKHLFRSKHENPNPQVRIQAIENLSKQDPQQKSILHELAFNDSDVNVSLAALDKLDSFALWYKMSEIAKNERVQKRSKKVVEDVLFSEGDNTLDEAEKRKFAVECQDNKLLEKLLFLKWVQQDTELAMQLLQRVDKPQLQEKLIIESQSESLQLAILSTLNDGPQQRKLLGRLLKKAKLDSVKQQSESLLARWKDDELKPIEVEKKVTMLLSRLLALKEQKDYAHIKTVQSSLAETYGRLQQEFNCLGDAKKLEIEQKYADISAKVKHVIDQLAPEWQAAQQAKEQLAKVESLAAEVRASLSQLSEQLAAGVADLVESDVEIAQQNLEQHNQNIQGLVSQLPADFKLEHKQLESLLQEVMASQQTLQQLPAFKEAIQQAQVLIEKYQALPLPSDLSQVDAAQEFAVELKQAWRASVAEYQTLVPNTLLEQWRQRSGEWQKAIQGLKKQISADVTRCRNKIRAVDSLIRQGKFKAAIGLYHKVHVWYQALPEKQQTQLSRAFNDAKQEVENLQDWQEYIAAPRKPALFNEVEKLIAEPLEIEQQAQAVKSLRAQWNSLGKLDTESDQALNVAFDEAIEKAFAPCRLHYENEQQIREQNLLAKQQILSELTALGASELNAGELAKALRALQQKWAKIGEVDYKQRAKVHEQYHQLCKPLKEQVNQYYLANQEQKQKLLDKALKLESVESIDEAVEHVKQLQAQWKTVEHAGRKAETELWAALRQANDKVFARRAEATQAVKQAVKQQVEQASELLTEMQKTLEQAREKGDIAQALDAKPELESLLQQLPSAQYKNLQSQLQRLLEMQKDKLQQLAKAAKQQHFVDMFALLKDTERGDDYADKIKGLPKGWQGCFQQTADNQDRQSLVIKMEILAEVDSPKEDAAARKDIQLQLMANKLQTGQDENLNDLLKAWIAAGPITQICTKQISRLESLFLKK